MSYLLFSKIVASNARYIRQALPFAFLLLTGCAVTTPTVSYVSRYPNEFERTHFDNITVISTQSAPEIAFDPAVSGKGEGAAKGAGNAVSNLWQTMPTGGDEVGAFIAIVYVALTPVVAIGGSVYGGVVAPSKEEVMISKGRINKALKELDVTDGLKEQITKAAEELWTVPVVDRSESDQEQMGAINEASKVTDSNTLLDVAIAGFTIKTSGGANPTRRVIFEASAKLENKLDGSIYYQGTHFYQSGAYLYKQWAENDAALLRNTFKQAYRELALNIVENSLVLYPLYYDNKKSKAVCRQPGDIAGLEIIYPKKRASRRTKVKVDSLRPTLLWQTFPRSSDVASPNSPLLRAHDIRYELRLYEAPATKDFTSGGKVTDIDGIRNASYTFDKPLVQGAHYFWSVRARFELDGHTRVTPWSGVCASHTTTTPVHLKFTHQFFTPGTNKSVHDEDAFDNF